MRKVIALILPLLITSAVFGQESAPPPQQTGQIQAAPSAQPALTKEEIKRQQEEAKREAKAREAQAKADAKIAAEQAKIAAKERKRQAEAERKAQALENTVPINVNRNYDRFKDYTLSILSEMPVYTPALNRGLTGPNFHMTAAIGYGGTTPGQTYEVVLGFNIRTTGMTPMWYAGPELLFLADGERISGVGSNVQWQTYVNWYPFLGNVQMIRTYSAVSLRYDDFVRIANAQNVEFRLGGIEARLLQRHLQAFRALLEQK